MRAQNRAELSSGLLAARCDQKQPKRQRRLAAESKGLDTAVLSWAARAMLRVALLLGAAAAPAAAASTGDTTAACRHGLRGAAPCADWRRSLQVDADADAGEGYAPDDDRYNPDGDEYGGAHGYGHGEIRRSLEDDGQDADGYGPDADGYGAGYGGEHSEVRRALTESDGYGAEGYAEGEGYADAELLSRLHLLEHNEVRRALMEEGQEDPDGYGEGDGYGQGYGRDEVRRSMKAAADAAE